MSAPTAWVAVDRDGRPLDHQCSHLDQIVEVPDPPAGECMDCIVEGTTWVNLRQCLVCGGVRCCDDSPRRHATAHATTSGHPLIRSAKPGEAWAWCYPEELFLVPAED
jgi:hypothetical protein